MAPLFAKSGPQITSSAELTAHFRSYIRVLNTRLFTNLASYVAPRVEINGKRLSQASFLSLIVPGAVFTPSLVVADVSKRTIAVRMDIEIPPSKVGEYTTVTNAPKREFVTEHVFYRFDDRWLIDQIFSLYSYGEATIEPHIRQGPRSFASDALQGVEAVKSPSPRSAKLPSPSLGPTRSGSGSASASASTSLPPSTSPTPPVCLLSRPLPLKALGESLDACREKKEAARIAIERVKEARARKLQMPVG